MAAAPTCDVATSMFAAPKGELLAKGVLAAPFGLSGHFFILKSD